MIWNKLRVDLIIHYNICMKVKKKCVIIKSSMMIDPVTGWFEITQYENKCVITIAKLVKTTQLTSYPCPIEITYNKGSGFIVHY